MGAPCVIHLGWPFLVYFQVGVSEYCLPHWPPFPKRSGFRLLYNICVLMLTPRSNQPRSCSWVSGLTLHGPAFFIHKMWSQTRPNSKGCAQGGMN